MKLTDLLTFLGGLSGAKSELMLMSPFERAFAGSDAESSSISVHADEFRQCFDIMAAMDVDQPGPLAAGESGGASAHGANRLGTNFRRDLIVVGSQAAVALLCR